MKNHIIRILIVWNAIIIPTPLISEVIHMKDGTMLRGSIVNQTGDAVYLRNAEGQKVIRKNAILRIVYINERRKPSREISNSNAGSTRPSVSTIYRDPVIALNPMEEFTWFYMHRDLLSQSEEAGDTHENPLPPGTLQPGSGIFTLFLRSVVMPGWGQIYNKRKEAGTAYTTAFLGAAVFALATYGKKQSDQESYASYSTLPASLSLLAAGSKRIEKSDAMLYALAVAEAGNRYNRLTHSSNMFNNALSVAGIIYLINLSDILMFSDNATLSVHGSINPVRKGFSVRFHFDL